MVRRHDIQTRHTLGCWCISRRRLLWLGGSHLVVIDLAEGSLMLWVGKKDYISNPNMVCIHSLGLSKTRDLHMTSEPRQKVRTQTGLLPK
jgi:hypothetical protein